MGEIYSQLCREAASFGLCVVAVEHEDGSSFGATTADGAPVPYVDNPRGKEAIRIIREPGLKKRIEEIRHTLDWIAAGDAGIRANSILISGHSFGAATAALAVQSLPDQTFQGAILFDMWSLPLPQKAFSMGFPRHTPAMAIFSEAFARVGEMDAARPMLTDVPIMCIPVSKHSDFSDLMWWVEPLNERRVAHVHAAICSALTKALRAFSVDGASLH